MVNHVLLVQQQAIRFPSALNASTNEVFSSPASLSQREACWLSDAACASLDAAQSAVPPDHTAKQCRWSMTSFRACAAHTLEGYQRQVMADSLLGEVTAGTMVQVDLYFV
jgi:hypothetical protein